MNTTFLLRLTGDELNNLNTLIGELPGIIGAQTHTGTIPSEADKARACKLRELYQLLTTLERRGEIDKQGADALTYSEFHRRATQ